MALPVRRFDRRVQRKNIQFTVIFLSINITNSREHFHFCIMVRPDSVC